MKVTTSPPVDPAIVAEVSELFALGHDPDAIIARMRTLGLHKIDCMKMFRNHAGVSLGQAKDIVHLSPAWADRYGADEAFHDAAEQALNTILAEDKVTAA